MQTVNGRLSNSQIPGSTRGKAAVRPPVGRMKLEGFLAWIKQCNTGKLAKAQYFKFEIADVVVGYSQPGCSSVLPTGMYTASSVQGMSKL